MQILHNGASDSAATDAGSDVANDCTFVSANESPDMLVDKRFVLLLLAVVIQINFRINYNTVIEIFVFLMIYVYI